MKIPRVDDYNVRWATIIVLTSLAVLLTTQAIIAQTNVRDDQQDQTLYELKIQQQQNLSAVDKLSFKVQTYTDKLTDIEAKQAALMQEMSRIEGGGAALMFILVVLQFLGIRGRQPRDPDYAIRQQLHPHHSRREKE